MSHFCDYIGIFTHNGFPGIAESIFCCLEYNDLKNAENVCKLWRQVILDGKIWKKLFKKMLRHPTMRKLYQHSEQNVDNDDARSFKTACHKLIRYHQRLLYSWMTAAQQEERLQHANPPGRQICLDMNSQYVVIGHKDGNILVRNRNDTAESKDYKELRLDNSPSGIHCLQLHEKNLLICGGTRGVIQIWDIHLGKLLKRFVETEPETIRHLRSQNGLLITGSNLEVTTSCRSRLTVWNIRNLNVSCLGEILFPTQEIYGLGLDNTFIVVLICDGPCYEVQVRKTQDFAGLSHSMKFRSRMFCGFHYEAGHIAAGLDDGQIKIWSAETGTCIRNLLRPHYDSGPIWFRFNSRFLVTSNSQGISIWNFKEAVNPCLGFYTKLRCSSFQTRAGSQPYQWEFQMDDFEIVRFEYSDDELSLPLIGRYTRPSYVVHHQFSNQLFY